MTIIRPASARYLMGASRWAHRHRRPGTAAIEAFYRDPCLRECMDWVERWHLHGDPGAREVLKGLCQRFPGHHSWHRALKGVAEGDACRHRLGDITVRRTAHARQLLFSDAFTSMEEGYALRRWVDRLLRKPPGCVREFISSLGMHSTGGHRLVCVMSEHQLEKVLKRLAPGPADRILQQVVALIASLQDFREREGSRGCVWVLDHECHGVARISTGGWNPWRHGGRTTSLDRFLFKADYRRDPVLLVWLAVLGDMAGGGPGPGSARPMGQGASVR
ncbi:hypothetical protein [Desulfoluna spongiiphila]|uniref:Uncharacterized protein n=1 Tax=Desulfoluna spongiiphila TaxID=419481 RepID=A0A1G5DL12_9BACT|nr:hypothetical protein [Desulfoluna spongiiphila]SCY15453.1 hypothetical protein SAMN05216233_104256 [Desulfoluna spongiiphila]